MHPLQTSSRAKCAHLRSRASRCGRRQPPVSLAASPSPAPKRDGFPRSPNEPSPISEHSTPPLPPTTRTKSPLPQRSQNLPSTSCPSRALAPLRASSNSPRLRVEDTLPTPAPNDPIPEHSTPPLPTTRTKPPLPPRTQPLSLTSCPSNALAPLRVASNSSRLRVEGTLSTLPPWLTPRFSTQYSQKLIRHILDFPVTAAPPSARRARA
jgi:hypothetical protein